MLPNHLRNDMSAPEEPKIIIDSDWKSQARAEKERLAHATTKPAPAAPPTGMTPGASAGPGAADNASPPGPGEPAGIRDLLSLLISQALAYMGAYPDPRTGQAVVALDLARFHIDLLEVLELKTKGNLTDEESRLLSRALNELRLEYVDVAKAVAKAVKEGRATTMGPGGPGAAPGIVSAPPAAAASPKLRFPGA